MKKFLIKLLGIHGKRHKLAEAKALEEMKAMGL